MTDNEAKMLNNKRKIALITGGSQRIGKVISRALIEEGWQVIIHYHSSQQEALFFAEQNEQIIGIENCDFTQTEIIEKFFETLIAKYGNISLLVNNAACFINDSLNDFSPTTFHKILDVNSVAPFILSKLFAAQEHFNPENPGHIINILDQTIKPNGEAFTGYALSKVLLEHFTKITASKFAPKVLVNAIALGMVMKGTRESNEHFEKLCSKSLLKRPVYLDDLKATIAFIATNQSLAGEVIKLDCGFKKC